MSSRLHKIDPINLFGTSTFQITERDLNGLPTKVKCLIKDTTWGIGDYVTNGTKMKGKITGFEFFVNESSSNISCFVTHTWSGICMALENLQIVIPIPSMFQVGDECAIKFESIKVPKATIQAVHFYVDKVKYDLEIAISTDLMLKTRIYNVDALICQLP